MEADIKFYVDRADKNTIMRFTYTNYKGITALRHARPLFLFFGTSEYYREDGDQWFWRALDLDRKGAMRDFALRLIKNPTWVDSYGGV